MNSAILYAGILLLLLCGNATAQTDKRVQPLLSALQTATNDTARVRLCNQYFNEWVVQDNGVAYQIAVQGAAIARKMGWPKAIAVFSGNIGTVKSNAGDYDSCMYYFQQAFAVHTANKDAFNAASMLNNMGTAASNLQSDYSTAASYFFRALHIVDSAGLQELTIICCTNIANTYFLQENYSKALAYAQRADSVAQQVQYVSRRGEIEKLLGNIYFKLNNRAAAKKHMEQALEIFVATENRMGEASMLGNLTMLTDSNFHYIITMRSKAAALWRDVNPFYLEALINMGNLGIAYADSAYKRSYLTGTRKDATQNELLQQAAVWLTQSIELSEQVGELDSRSIFIGKLAEVSALRKDWEKAYLYYRQYREIQDTVFSQASKNAIAAAESQRLIERKENEVKLAQLTIGQQRKTAVGLGVGVLLLAVIGLLLFRQNRLKQKANTQLQDLNTALAEANDVKTTFFSILSHDLRGPVARVANLLHLQNQHPELLPAGASQQVAKSVDDLLETMDDVLLWSKGQMQQFAPVIESISLPSFLQKLSEPYRQMPGIYFSIAVANHLTANTDVHFLASIIQNITNNAVKALANTTQATIEWHADLQQGQVVIRISDNGPGIAATDAAGLQQHAPVKSSKTGLGFHIIRDMAAAIGSKIDISANPAGGTTVAIYL
ncbi:MAG: tetratricopeptide repeat-containing sensor histidine kinase [Chitinophagaceae bacterium]|nr:tetratricopeptide repeat-containing sensor histidine kinase [Chitinophagaceae bacterium]